MESVLITGILTILSGTITFILGHMAGRKKRAADTDNIYAETESLRIATLKSAIDIYKQVYRDLDEQLKLVLQKCSTLSGEIDVLRSENVALKKEIHQLTEQLKSK